MRKKIAVLLFTGILGLSGISNCVLASDLDEDYQLEKMVVFSRHNMRAPIESTISLMEELTPYTWTDFTAPAGELTMLGGTQETAMGQYFRKYLVSKGLMDEDWLPEEGQTRFYANSNQRTIATAQYFKTGLLPISNVDVEYLGEVGSMDPVFNSCIHFTNDAYEEQVQEEIDAMADGQGMQGLIDSYADGISLIEEVLDIKDSDYAKENNVSSIPMDTTTLSFELDEKPKITGGVDIAYSAADALIMQYYAEPDLEEASFGESLTYDQWKSIGSVYTLKQLLQYGAPSVAINVTHPLLQELESEMTNDDRIFSFLCGHDSNMLPLLVALDVEDYEIDNNISDAIPIGSKLVWEKYLGKDGVEYARFSMVYQDSEKLRENKLVTLNDPPTWLELNLSGLEKNEDGLYLWDDVISRFDEVLAAYDVLACEEADEAA